MAITQAERDVIGQALDPVERAVLGLVGGVAAAGHGALGLAAITLLYVLLGA